VLIMSVNAPITIAELPHEARSHTHRTFPDGFVTFIRFTFRAREGIDTLPLGGRFENWNVAGINPARTDPGGGWSPMAMERPAQAGAPTGRHRRGACLILESRHARTLDGAGKASPGHPIRKQFGKLTRAANAKRWPEQLQA
jgi:hypothetical protein